MFVLDPLRILIDVRTREEFEEGHISSAVNVDIAAPAFVEVVKRVTEGKSVCCYCHSGRRSEIAVYMLRLAGIDAIDIPGGVLQNPELLG